MKKFLLVDITVEARMVQDHISQFVRNKFVGDIWNLETTLDVEEIKYYNIDSLSEDVVVAVKTPTGNEEPETDFFIRLIRLCGKYKEALHKNECLRSMLAWEQTKLHQFESRSLVQLLKSWFKYRFKRLIRWMKAFAKEAK